jgi:hypothetical protein
MDEIEVTSRCDSQGRIIPVEFVWKRRKYIVGSLGRNWEVKGTYHILVMSPENQVFHLMFNIVTAQWYMLLPGTDIFPS